MASKWGGSWWIGASLTVVLIVGIGIFIALGTNVPFIPERAEFERIRSIPYDTQTMNCIDKSVMYADYLRVRNWTCWTAVGKVIGERDDHAWVIVLDEKKARRLCDPTAPVGGPSGYEEETYALYRPRAYCGEGVVVE